MQTHFSDRKRAYNRLQATAFGDASADMNRVSVRTRVGGAARTVAIPDQDGDWNYDGTAQNTIWDEYDDVALLSGLRASVISEKEQLGERWQEWLDYARPILSGPGWCITTTTAIISSAQNT